MARSGTRDQREARDADWTFHFHEAWGVVFARVTLIARLWF